MSSRCATSTAKNSRVATAKHTVATDVDNTIAECCGEASTYVLYAGPKMRTTA